jgi:hypothetical protein
MWRDSGAQRSTLFLFPSCQIELTQKENILFLCQFNRLLALSKRYVAYTQSSTQDSFALLVLRQYLCCPARRNSTSDVPPPPHPGLNVSALSDQRIQTCAWLNGSAGELSLSVRSSIILKRGRIDIPPRAPARLGGSGMLRPASLQHAYKLRCDTSNSSPTCLRSPRTQLPAPPPSAFCASSDRPRHARPRHLHFVLRARPWSFQAARRTK